jgi:tRNA pseudouridine38-40 synthase
VIDEDTTTQPQRQRRLRVDLAYEGGPFAGFARQPDQVTVQGVLEDALSRVVGHPVDTTGAGRTDRGVHALAQVVHADVTPADERAVTALDDLDALATRLHRMVGPPITVWSVREVDDTFDARFSATWRAYRYRLAPGRADPRIRGIAWAVGHDLAPAPMADAVRVVVGEHDFASFCRRAEGRTTVRRIEEADVHVVPPDDGRAVDELHVTLRGSAFCHQQVRSIVGSLVEVGRGRRTVDWFAAALAARDRSAAGPVAPPQGLTLEAVGYPAPWPDAPVRPRPSAVRT